MKSLNAVVTPCATSSLPSWECGLKSGIPAGLIPLMHVTPFVGVWIEITGTFEVGSVVIVTPFVGVWIEISYTNIGSKVAESLPSWECGLKLPLLICLSFASSSHSLRGSVD